MKGCGHELDSTSGAKDVAIHFDTATLIADTMYISAVQ